VTVVSSARPSRDSACEVGPRSRNQVLNSRSSRRRLVPSEDDAATTARRMHVAEGALAASRTVAEGPAQNVVQRIAVGKRWRNSAVRAFSAFVESARSPVKLVDGVDAGLVSIESAPVMAETKTAGERADHAKFRFCGFGKLPLQGLGPVDYQTHRDAFAAQAPIRGEARQNEWESAIQGTTPKNATKYAL